MQKRLFALVLAFCLVLTLVPAPAFAEGEPETPVCTCETACTAEKKNTECPVCGAEGATPEKCGKYEAPEPEPPVCNCETACGADAMNGVCPVCGAEGATPENCGKYAAPEPTAAQKVQSLINALPDAVTAENREDVEAQLTAIDGAKASLTDEERATLDFTKYDAAIAAINVLDNQPGAEVPKTLETKSLEGATVSVTKPFPYNGAPQNLMAEDVTVTLTDGTPLTTDDFTLTATAQTYPGNYSFTVTGAGNYTGTANGNWTIKKGSLANQDIYLMMKEGETSITVNVAEYLPNLGAGSYVNIFGSGGPNDVATTRMNAVITPHNESADITLKVQGSPYYEEFSVYLHIVKAGSAPGEAKDLNVSMVGWNMDDKPNTPTVTGLPDTPYNYKVTYTKNSGDTLTGVPTEIGQYTVTITCADIDNNTYSGSADFFVWLEVNLDANGGQLPAEASSILQTTTGKLDTLPVPTWAGYTFQGWYTEEKEGERVSKETVYSDNTTLYAHWELDTYTVHFDANGGEGTMADQTMAYGQTESLSPNGFTRTGYTFTGWNTQADGKGTGYNNEDEVSNLTTNGGTVTLYAQWQANTYTVYFDANGGEGTMANQTMTCDKSEGLKANAFTMDGHIFHGWNTQPDGNGAFYADGQTVQNLTTEKDTVVTLFAQWELIVNEVNLTLSGHEIDKRVDGVKLTSEEHITFNGAYGSAWGIATNKNTLKTQEGKVFQADTQYYLWVIFSPEEGCTLEGLTARDVTLDGTAALSLEDMQGSRMALFRLPVIYTVTVTAGKNGSVSSDSTINAKGIIAVFEGEDVTIQITPDSGYVVYRLTVDGTSVKTARTYTFENIQQSHTLKARFLKNGTNAKTGDSFPLIPAIAVLTLSAAALVAVVVIAKKKMKK